MGTLILFLKCFYVNMIKVENNYGTNAVKVANLSSL